MPKSVQVLPHRFIKAAPAAHLPRVLATTPVASAQASPHASFRVHVGAANGDDLGSMPRAGAAGADTPVAATTEDSEEDVFTCVMDLNRHVQFNFETGSAHQLVAANRRPASSHDKRTSHDKDAGHQDTQREKSEVRDAAEDALGEADVGEDEAAKDRVVKNVAREPGPWEVLGARKQASETAEKVASMGQASLHSGDMPLEHGSDTGQPFQMLAPATGGGAGSGGSSPMSMGGMLHGHSNESCSAIIFNSDASADVTARCEIKFELHCQEVVVGHEDHFSEGLVSDIAIACELEQDCFSVSSLNVASMSAEVVIFSNKSKCSPLATARLLQQQVGLSNSCLRRGLCSGNVIAIRILDSPELRLEAVRIWRRRHLHASFSAWVTFCATEEGERELIVKILDRMGNASTPRQVDDLPSTKGGVINERAIGKVLQRILSDSFARPKQAPAGAKGQDTKVSRLVNNLETPARWKQIRLQVKQGGFAAVTPSAISPNLQRESTSDPHSPTDQESECRQDQGPESHQDLTAGCQLEFGGMPSHAPTGQVTVSPRHWQPIIFLLMLNFEVY